MFSGISALVPVTKNPAIGSATTAPTTPAVPVSPRLSMSPLRRIVVPLMLTDTICRWVPPFAPHSLVAHFGQHAFNGAACGDDEPAIEHHVLSNLQADALTYLQQLAFGGQRFSQRDLDRRPPRGEYRPQPPAVQR